MSETSERALVGALRKYEAWCKTDGWEEDEVYAEWEALVTALRASEAALASPPPAVASGAVDARSVVKLLLDALVGPDAYCRCPPDGTGPCGLCYAVEQGSAFLASTAAPQPAPEAPPLAVEAARLKVVEAARVIVSDLDDPENSPFAGARTWKRLRRIRQAMDALDAAEREAGK